MNFKYMSKIEAEKAMTEAKGDTKKLQALNNSEFYERLRKELQLRSRTIKYKYFGDRGDISKKPKIQGYKYDLLFGLELYEVLTSEVEFKISLREASNPEFWIYLSVVGIPDIISERWEGHNSTRFYSQNTRNWLYTLWWYIHLSWQGSIADTKKIIEKNSTDTILNLVERTSPKGYNIKLYRTLMHEYSKINKASIKNKGRDIFRTIQVTNTSLIQTIEPSLFKGGEITYVKKLFKLINLVEVNGEYVEKEEE